MHCFHIFVFVFGIINICTAVNMTDSIVIPGDVLIGGLFPMHFDGNRKCGPISPFTGIQEIGGVMFYLKKINEVLYNSTGIRLGMVAMDTCYSTDRALEEALVLAQNRYRGGLPPLNTSFSNSGSMTDKIRDRVIAVLGPTASEESISVATLLKLFKIPQVSVEFSIGNLVRMFKHLCVK